MPVPRHNGHAVASWRATALRMNSLLLGIASRSAANSGSTLNATICLLARGFLGTAPPGIETIAARGASVEAPPPKGAREGSDVDRSGMDARQARIVQVCRTDRR